MKKLKNKICIAMSGGIDSSVAAAILKNQGYNCIGIFMKFWSDPSIEIDNDNANKCCSIESFQSARRIAHKLGFPIYTVNFKKPFKKQVVDDFLYQYKIGRTPNPCVTCNKFIKFDLLWKKAKMLNCNFLATGHYVIKTADTNQNSKFKLFQGKDKNKDQSYFLYNLKPHQLKNLLFPLGNYTKPQVREMAKKFNIPESNRPESQEICFTPKNHNEFLKRYLKLKSGPITNTGGKIIGRHEGLPLYTLGQRKGIKIGGPGPFYVVKIDYQKNTLIVSNKKNDPLLYSKQFTIKKTNWLIDKKDELICQVKIRYQSPSVKCKVKNNSVTLFQPQRAIVPGQSAVFYNQKQIIGGGIIDRIK